MCSSLGGSPGAVGLRLLPRSCGQTHRGCGHGHCLPPQPGRAPWLAGSQQLPKAEGNFPDRAGETQGLTSAPRSPWPPRGTRTPLRTGPTAEKPSTRLRPTLAHEQSNAQVRPTPAHGLRSSPCPALPSAQATRSPSGAPGSPRRFRLASPTRVRGSPRRPPPLSLPPPFAATTDDSEESERTQAAAQSAKSSSGGGSTRGAMAARRERNAAARPPPLPARQALLPGRDLARAGAGGARRRETRRGAGFGKRAWFKDRGVVFYMGVA